MPTEPNSPQSLAPDAAQTVQLCGGSYRVHHLPALAAKMGISLEKLPYSIKVLLENLLRHYDDETVTQADIECVANYSNGQYKDTEIAFYPARVLMPDSSGLPLLVDLASMRDRVAGLGKDPGLINPLIPVDLVVDHSITTEFAGTADARAK
ncbi:MAG: aconitate hydratase, partial [Betaproteobacteria bacterium]|nr:aconitate hydratase [Betaproteobacteria bacterium]